MKNIVTKIVTFTVLGLVIMACDAEKRLTFGERRLVENKIVVNDKVVKDDLMHDLLYQQPNATFLGNSFRLHLYNLAISDSDSLFALKLQQNNQRQSNLNKWLSAKQVDRLGNSFWHKGIHEFLKKTGEPPVIVDLLKTKKSVSRFQSYYFNNGYFNTKVNFTVDSIIEKQARIQYSITTGQPYIIDAINRQIKTISLDSLYQTEAQNSQIISGKQYNTQVLENEKVRINNQFRNHGVYNFQPNFVSFVLDTLVQKGKVDVKLVINDYSFQDKDTTRTEPFKIYKISDVNIYTDYSPTNTSATFKDSTQYNNFNLFSVQKLKYKPKAITDAVFITKGSLFSDLNSVLTSRYLNNLKIFNYPTILYEVDNRDSTKQSLIAKVYLAPRKKFSFGASFDLSHSNIQDVGIAGNITQTIRNVFNKAETLEFSVRGSIGSTRDNATTSSNFFNVSEIGLDMKLNFPRIWFAIPTERIIPKSMIPYTTAAVGLSNQKNIGLDKENVTGFIAYNWNPKKQTTARFDLVNIQYVRNLNSNNYFNVYRSSYAQLNSIQKKYPDLNLSYLDQEKNLLINDGTTGFTNDVLSRKVAVETIDLKAVRSIEERRKRLTENDFIIATSFAFSKLTKVDPKDNSFYQFRAKLESAGTLLSLFANATKLPKNVNENFEIFNVEYSEYFKVEFDFVKYWDLPKNQVLAIRSFFGWAIPYGNSDNVPFSRSYFAGGSNDNRAWEPYRLGPGSSGAVNDFNEANMKVACSVEYRFNIFGSLNGALFADAGNIWNTLDNVTELKSAFEGPQDLKELALGTGFGLRYDLDFFVVRLDLGFKTYNPALELNKRWFTEFDLSSAVFNFGINYPF